MMSTMIKNHTMEYRPPKQWLPTRQMFPDMYGNDVVATLSHIEIPSFTQRENHVPPPCNSSYLTLRHLDVPSPYNDVASSADVNSQDVNTTYSNSTCSYDRLPYTNYTSPYAGVSSRYVGNSCPDMYNRSSFNGDNSGVDDSAGYLTSSTERQHGGYYFSSDKTTVPPSYAAWSNDEGQKHDAVYSNTDNALLQETSMDESEKRRLKRDRNRRAARRCREKQRSRTEALEEEVLKLQLSNKKEEEEITKLRAQIKELRDMLQEHVCCIRVQSL